MAEKQGAKMSKLLLFRDVIFSPMAPYVPRRGNILEEAHHFMLSSFLAPTLTPYQPFQPVYSTIILINYTSICVFLLSV